MRNSLLLSGVFASVLSLFATTAYSKTLSPVQAAQKLIPNFVVVSAEAGHPATGIFRGGNPIDKGQNGIATLVPLGVVTDVDLQGGDEDQSIEGWFDQYFEAGEKPAMIEKEKQLAETNGMEFVSLPMDSHGVVTQAENTEIGVALNILKNATVEKPVFIHCEGGKDRTGLVIALYRVLVQGWTVAAAHKEWESLGHTDFSQIVTGDLDKYFYQATALEK